MKRYKTIGWRICVILFLLCFSFGSSITTFAASNAWGQWQAVIRAEESSQEHIMSMQNTFAVELWHYSGGYWGNEFVRIYDSQVFDDADKLAEAVNAVMEFEMPLPQEVTNILNEGYNVDVVLETNGIPLGELFMLNKGISFKYENGALYFRAYPKFNFDKRYNYRDHFVSGLSKQIPFVVSPYGYNRYAMWTKAGSSVGAANGYFNPDDIYDVGSAGHIHPSQIINNKGYLQDGLDIYVDRENGTFDWMSSNDIAIGYHTFANAGAVAVHFDYPVTISFYKGGKMGEPSGGVPIDGPGNGDNCDEPFEPHEIDTDEVKKNDSTVCGDKLRWTEIASHTVRTPCRQHGWHERECIHAFTYETALDTSHTITPKTLKSGYGFAVTADTAITTQLASNIGGCDDWGAGREPEKTPQAPTKAEVRLNYTVSNILGTQNSTVALEQTSSNKTSTAFITAPNPISVTGARTIYTDVALPGTAEQPAVHQFEIYLHGGGVNGVEFCKSISESITINGSMYDDDGTTS